MFSVYNIIGFGSLVDFSDYQVGREFVRVALLTFEHHVFSLVDQLSTVLFDQTSDLFLNTRVTCTDFGDDKVEKDDHSYDYHEDPNHPEHLIFPWEHIYGFSEVKVSE